MSLTSLLDNPVVREKFAEFIRYPKIIEGPILFEPRTKNYGVVGTAFDYLMRFYIQKINKQLGLHIGWWLAEVAESAVIYHAGKDPSSKETEDNFVEATKILVQNYIDDEVEIEELIVPAMKLARRDIVFRAGDEYLKDADSWSEEDADDLRNLMSAVNPKAWRAERFCLLNPTFGVASAVYGGADADIILDKTLIDFKVSKSVVSYSRKYINQLVGYYMLNLLDRCQSTGINIERLGIYSARRGQLFVYDVDEIIDKISAQNLFNWLKEYGSFDRKKLKYKSSSQEKLNYDYIALDAEKIRSLKAKH